MAIDAANSTGKKLVMPLAMARKTNAAIDSSETWCPYRHSYWRDMLTRRDEHLASPSCETPTHAAIGTGGTCQRGQSRHWLLRNTLKHVNVRLAVF